MQLVLFNNFRGDEDHYLLNSLGKVDTDQEGFISCFSSTVDLYRCYKSGWYSWTAKPLRKRESHDTSTLQGC